MTMHWMIAHHKKARDYSVWSIKQESIDYKAVNYDLIPLEQTESFMLNNIYAPHEKRFFQMWDRFINNSDEKLS